MLQFEVYDPAGLLIYTIQAVNAEWFIGLVLGAIVSAVLWIMLKGGS